MLKRVTNYFLVIILLFSLSTFIVNAQYKEGTCKNPSGGTYCGQKSSIADCYCDSDCIVYGDCCSDYKEVCSTPTSIIGKVTVGQGSNQTPSCTDSDGGINYNVKGTAQSVETVTDVCYDYLNNKISDTCKPNQKDCVLVEYYCNQCSGLVKEQYSCPYGCKDGACIQKKQITKNDVIDYIEKDGVNAKITKEEALNYVKNKCYGSYSSSGGVTGYTIMPIIIS